MAKLLIKRKAYKRDAYTRKGGVKVSGSKVPQTTFKIKDVGAPGRTPKAKRWFEPKVHSGWSKDLSQKVRIAKVVKAHKGDLLASARSLQSLANVTVDIETRHKAKADADVLFARHSRTGK